MKKVVVVESPAKAKTINRYLGNDYTVLASYGHIRDLPSKNGSVKPDDDFQMIWEVDERSDKHIAAIAKAVKNADELYLATDPDREGEAISWHVQEVLREKNVLKDQPVMRIVFHEITKTAIQQAIKSPRAINQELVEAYLARRALDYLVGFTLSPVLWRKLPGSRSAGRVQSVALRLITDREQEIESFVSREYWSVLGDFKTALNTPFSARLTYLDGKKLDKFDLNNEKLAEAACSAIKKQSYSVDSIDKKQVKRNPSAPFITSTLQQEASRKLGFTASRTMQVAQKLYEGIDVGGGEVTGLITYMRTDSVTISKEAVEDIRSYVKNEYGQNYVPSVARTFKNKSKNAQEAHEAIRPTSTLRKPQEMKPFLDDSQLKLYDLIWKRTVASQMENALFNQVSIDIMSADQKITLRATGSTLVFDGFLRLYQEGVDDAEDQDNNRLLPPMEVKESLSLENVTPNQHFTQPAPRYTEASLVKKMEELGIGRPSTYASIIHVLQDRKYVRLEKKQFIPEDRGRLVTSFLINFFQRYVEYDFTAQLEEQLDEISQGGRQWKSVLTNFWTSFIETVNATQSLTVPTVLESLERDLSFHLFQGKEEARKCPTCETGRVGLKLSRFGAFLGCSNYPDCRYTRQLLTDGAGEELVPMADEPKILGTDDTGATISLRKGPYGYYLQWDGGTPVEEAEEILVKEDTPTKKKKKTVKKDKPKRVTVPPTLEAATITFEQALKLGELPKKIGIHPETGEVLVVNIGRFGPYIKNASEFVSIPKAYDLFSVSLETALELIEKKKNSPKRSRVVPIKKKAKPKKV